MNINYKNTRRHNENAQSKLNKNKLKESRIPLLNLSDNAIDYKDYHHNNKQRYDLNGEKHNKPRKAVTTRSFETIRSNKNDLEYKPKHILNKQEAKLINKTKQILENIRVVNLENKENINLENKKNNPIKDRVKGKELKEINQVQKVPTTETSVKETNESTIIFNTNPENVDDYLEDIKKSLLENEVFYFL